MEMLQKIIDMSVLDYDDFVDSQKQDLAKASYFCPISDRNTVTKTTKFLGEKTRVVTGYAPLVIDDDEVYKILFDNIKLLSVEYSDKATLISKAVQKSVFDYFGYGKPDDLARTMIYRDAYDRETNVSIRAFRNNSLSMCTERSCLAHNMFKMLGVESCLVSSNITLNNQQDLHVYNVVRIDGQGYVYDLVCTPTRVDKPMSKALMHKLTYEQSVKFFDSRERTKDINSINCKFKSQMGCDYNVCYINGGKSNEHNDAQVC